MCKYRMKYTCHICWLHTCYFIYCGVIDIDLQIPPVEGDLHYCMCCDLCYNDCNSVILCFEMWALFGIFIFVTIQKHCLGNILLDCL